MENLDTQEFIQYLENLHPDASKFQVRKRGFVDWKFSELCHFKGFADAVQYAETMRRWVDFNQKYTDCLLNVSFEAYLEAVKKISQ